MVNNENFILMRSFQRIRMACHLTWVGIMLACFIYGGKTWLQGSFLGGLIVEINFLFLNIFLKKAPFWQGRSLFSTLLWFYLIFAFTAAFCWVSIKFHFGEPLSFFAGLLCFVVSLFIGLISLGIKKVGNVGPSGEK